MAVSGTVLGQKQYAWCPEDVFPAPRPDALRGLVIDVVFTDARVFTSKVKNKCEVSSISSSFVTSLQKAFPGASIGLASSAEGRDGGNRVLVELSLTAYSSTFISTNWISAVSLSVKVTDSRGESAHPLDHQIAKEKKAFNMGGMATAKKNLTLAYVDATSEMIDYLATLLR